MIGRAIGSLAVAQDYPGSLRVVLVDDGSSDGTGDLARAAGSARLTVIRSSPPPPDWTGKLWAMRHGIEEAGASPRYLWFTDAEHRARAEHPPLARRTRGARRPRHEFADGGAAVRERGRASVGPGVRVLLPDALSVREVNRPSSRVAAAAGGCMLVDRAALESRGGLRAIRGALIDDCALGALMKNAGPIRLTLTRRCQSIRPYGGWPEIAAMISRSAYAQLGYSPVLLLGTLAGMALVYVNPLFFALAGPGWPPCRRSRRVAHDGDRLPADASLLSPLSAVGSCPSADRSVLRRRDVALGLALLAGSRRDVEGPRTSEASGLTRRASRSSRMIVRALP
ncbi:MAG: glycosyltransferase [Rhizomicrobium sp.]